jgi:hypothetical protein
MLLRDEWGPYENAALIDGSMRPFPHCVASEDLTLASGGVRQASVTA